MATFVMLSRVHPEGLKTLHQTPERIKAVDHEAEALGARVLSQYALLGEYDFLTVLEAPDAETAARISVELGMRGTVTIETLTAIRVDDFINAMKKH